MGCQVVRKWWNNILFVHAGGACRGNSHRFRHPNPLEDLAVAGFFNFTVPATPTWHVHPASKFIFVYIDASIAKLYSLSPLDKVES